MMDAIKAAVFLLLLPLAMTIEFRALFSVLKLEKYDELEQGLENGFTEFIKTLENPQEIDFSSFEHSNENTDNRKVASTAAGKEARKENLLEVQRIQTVFERCSAYTSEAYEMIKITKEEMGKPNLAKQKAIIGKTMNPSLNQEVEDLALRVFSSFKTRKGVNRSDVKSKVLEPIMFIHEDRLNNEDLGWSAMTTPMRQIKGESILAQETAFLLTTTLTYCEVGKNLRLNYYNTGKMHLTSEELADGVTDALNKLQVNMIMTMKKVAISSFDYAKKTIPSVKFTTEDREFIAIYIVPIVASDRENYINQEWNPFIQQVISKSKEHDIDVTEFSLVEGIQSLFIILGMAYILMHLRRILRQNRPRNFQLET